MKAHLACFLVVILLPMNAHSGNSSKKLISNENVQISKPFDLEQVGKLEELGFERSNGGQVYDGDDDHMLYSQSYCRINRDHFPSRPVQIESCVIVIETLVGRHSDGKPIFRNEDALQIDLNGYKLFDQGDTGCSSSIHPKYSIFAIGHWKWRKLPLVGGYAHSLKQAWEVEPTNKKLVEIPVKSVKCEINEDRD